MCTCLKGPPCLPELNQGIAGPRWQQVCVINVVSQRALIQLRVGVESEPGCHALAAHGAVFVEFVDILSPPQPNRIECYSLMPDPTTDFSL
jgi:hypothetical protein